MELELGLKITKTRDDIDSISEYQFMKDTGPVFKSRETNTMFILTAHLKGFKRNNIDINISKDGNKISIRGKKPIQEMVMMGWVMQRKVVDVKGFNKVFKIPYGVNLDKIKANYNEEEWMLNIVMPKLVKGIFGLKIEEFKEQEFDKGRTKQGSNDFDNVSSSVGETSQKESKESEFQHMEGSENVIEKMIDDNKKEINEERMQKEVGEYKLRIEDGNGESVSGKGGKEEYEASKKMEIDQSVVIFMSKEIEDTSQDREFEDQKLNSRSVDKRLDDVNRDLIGSTIEKDKEESKLRIKDDKVKDTSQFVFEESIIQQSGESKQKEFEEPKCESKVRFEESMKESSKEPFEAMKVPKLDENLVDHIPNNIDCINQTQLKEENEKPPFEAYEDVQKPMFEDTIQKEIIKPNKEGFDAKIINEEFPKNLLPKNSNEESEGMNNQKMQETKNEKEEMVSKEVEYFVEKGEGERLKMMHVDAKKGNKTNETLKKEIEESDNENKENDKQRVEKIESSGINDEKKEEQKEVMEESLVENESLIVEGDESKERTKEIVQDEEDKIENSIVKLKGEGSTKMHVDLNEPFEGENVNIGIFDGRETKMFHEIEQTKDVNEKGENVEYSLKKVNRDKYEKIQNEENEGVNVQKELEIKDAKENVVKRKGKEIEYFVEKGEDDRLKSMHVKEMKGNNTIEKMQDGIEKSEHGIKESGKQHANENTIKEVLPRQVAEIDGTKEFDVAKEEEKYEVLNEGLVESESLVEMVQGEESNQMTKTIVQDDEDKIEYNIDKLKENEPAKIHFEPNDPFEENIVGEKLEKEIRNQNLESINELSEKENANIGKFDGRKANKFQEMKQTEDVKEKNEKIGNFAKIVNEKIQNEEDEDLKKNTTKEKDECCLQEEMSDGRCQATKSRKEDFSMKMLDSKIDAREEPKDRKMEKTKGINEENGKIQVEENEGLRKDITKRKQNKSEETKLVKFKDQQSFQKEKSKGTNEANTIEKELPMKTIDSLERSREGPKDKEIDGKKIVESTTKEELQGFEIETTSKVFEEHEENNSKVKEIGTPERTFQSVASTGFKEFDYGNAKDKKQNTNMKKEETHESKDESINQDILNQKKTKDGGEQCGYNNVSAKEVGTIDDEVVKSLSTPKFQISQSEVEEKDKLCEGSKAKYKGSIEPRQNHTKDIQNFIEMKENEVVEQNDTLKQEMSLEKELKKEEKGEFLNGETMREKTDEPKNKDKSQNANDENFKTHGEITKDGIENEKCIHETKTPLELEKTIVQWKFPKTKDQHDYGIEEMKLSKNAECQEAKASKLQRPRNNQQSTDKIKAIGEHESTKDSPKLSIVETAKIDSLQPQFLDGQENVLQKKEEPKVAKIEDELASTLQREIIKTTQTTEEKELKMKGITTPFEKASGSKRVEEKVHDTPHRELQREIQEVTSKMVESYTTAEKNSTKKGERKDPQELTRPNMECEISKVEEVQKENEEESYIHVLEEGTDVNEVESLEASLNNDSVQHESRAEEIKEPKNATYQEAKTSKLQSSRIKQQFKDEINRKSEENIDSLPPHLLDEQEVLHVQEKNDKKGIHTPNIVVDERGVTKTEESMVAKNEETNNSSTLKRVSGKSKSKEENKPKMKEITAQFEKASGSKSVGEKVHQTPKREDQRGLEEVTSKIEVEAQTTVEKTPLKGVERKEPLELTSPPNMVNEILKVEEKEGQKHIQILEDTMAKGKEDRSHQYVQEKNKTKGFQTQNTIEEEEVVKKMEVAKVAKSEETKDDCTFKRQDGKITQASKFDKASSGSKRVGEKVHETSDRNHQRELEEVTSKMDNEIPKVKEFRKEEVERHIQELEANTSKEKDRVKQKEDTSSQLNSTVPKNSPTKKHFHTVDDTPTLEVVADKVVQQLEVPSASCTEQLEVEEEEKEKERESKIDVHESKKCKRGKEIQQCINNDEEAKHGIEEIKDEEKDNEQVFEGQKEGEDGTRGGKKDNAKISKEFFVPLVIAGSALIVTLIAIFVRQRRARKR